MQNMQWSDVRVFLEVHRGGTLSAAGRALGVYASTVGRRLKAFEHAMGTVLFQRTPEGLIPTAVADELVEAAVAMERQAQLITQRASGESHALRGRVRLALTPDLATHFLIERLGLFHERHPDIEVDLLSSVGLADLGRGEADIALRFSRSESRPVPRAHEEVLLARRLPDIGIGVYAAGDYLHRRGRPESSRDLSGHDLIMPSQEWVPGHDWMSEHGRGARTVLSTDTITGLGIAARAGYGIAPLPSFIAFGHAELERIRPPDRIATIRFWLLMPRDLRRVARVRALRDFLVEVFEEWSVLMAGGDD